MANLPRLEELTQKQLQMLQEACSSFYPVEILGDGYKGSEATEFSIAELGLSWKSQENFLNDILKITNQKDIRSANKILEKYAGEAPKEVERPESQTQTTPSNPEELEKERSTRETSEKEAWENAKREVERAKQKLEEIQLEKDKKLHVKVTSKEEVKFTEDEQKVYENYKEYSKQNPKQAVEELSQEIKSRVGEDLKTQGFTNDEIEDAAKGTATQLVENFTQADNPNYIPLTHHTAVLASIANNKQLAGNFVSESANNVATAHLLQYQKYKDITASAFGKYFADENFGVDADKVDVEISEIPQPGFTQTVNPYQVVQSNKSILDDQSQSMALVKEFGVDKAKGILLNRAGGVLEKRIALLTPQSAAGKLLQSMEAKSLLFSTFGVGTPIKWEATNLIGKLALKVAPDYAIPAISWASKATGINFGIRGSTIATGVAKEAGKQVVKAGTKGVGAKVVGTILGPFSGIPIAGQVLNWLLAEVVVRLGGALLSKLGEWWKKNRDWAGPMLLGGAGFALFGPAAGLGMAGLGFAIARKLTPAMIGFGIWNFFRTLGGAFVMTIATPIIVTLLVLPPLVAFIMLVINTGAYLVPPGPLYDISGRPSGGGIQIVCSEEKGSVGVDGPASSSLIANRAWEITFDLYQGFWCYWNRSPIAPKEYFPNDTLQYPDGYPELFDYEAYLRDPNSTPPSGNLFWCTYLVVKSYQDSNVDVPFELNSQDMFDTWPRQKILPNEATPDNVVPGSVIFFQVHGPGHPDRINHVGIVYSVDQGGIVFVESNAGVKSQSMNFVSGKISSGIGDMELKGFGLPN